MVFGANYIRPLTLSPSKPLIPKFQISAISLFAYVKRCINMYEYNIYSVSVSSTCVLNNIITHFIY
jgi:hypothetical protein